MPLMVPCETNIDCACRMNACSARARLGVRGSARRGASREDPGAGRAAALPQARLRRTPGPPQEDSGQGAGRGLAWLRWRRAVGLCTLPLRSATTRATYARGAAG